MDFENENKDENEFHELDELIAMLNAALESKPADYQDVRILNVRRVKQMQQVYNLLAQMVSENGQEPKEVLSIGIDDTLGKVGYITATFSYLEITSEMLRQIAALADIDVQIDLVVVKGKLELEFSFHHILVKM